MASRNHINTAYALMLLLVLTMGDATAASQSVDSTEGATPRLILRVERREIDNRRVQDTLDITLETVRFPAAGFDLKIACNSPFLDIVGVLPGRILDSCKWDYFAARRLDTRTKNNAPLTMWKAVGLAQMASDTVKPICFGFDTAASLVRIIVSNRHVLRMPETTAAIFFFWEQCSDNVISGRSGERLALSSSVIDYYPVDLPDTDMQFPTHQGAPRQCVKLSAANPPERFIEFHNGGISFRYRAADSSRTRESAVQNDSATHGADSSAR